jgi:hypothetical protein
LVISQVILDKKKAPLCQGAFQMLFSKITGYRGWDNYLTRLLRIYWSLLNEQILTPGYTPLNN